MTEAVKKAVGEAASEYLAQGDGEWIQMKCGACGQASGYERWTRTEITGDLPAGEFQCPKCGSAFRRERYEGDPMRLIDGRYTYRPIDLVPISTRL